MINLRKYLLGDIVIHKKNNGRPDCYAYTVTNKFKSGILELECIETQKYHYGPASDYIIISEPVYY